MKAAHLNNYGSADHFEIVDIPKPVPAPDEVLIKVQYAGLRWGDIMARNGIPLRNKIPPFVPGQEAAGVVEAVGSNVTRLKPGMRVVASTLGGAYAEYLTTAQDTVSLVPDGLALEKVLVYQINLRVAYLLVYPWGKIQPGETVLLHAAAGGVGLLALQVMKRLSPDIRVVALASTDEKLALCRKHGADFCINYKQTDYVKECLRLLGGRKIDIALNGVAGPTLKTDPKVIRPRGRWIIYGSAAGGEKVNLFSFAYDSITVMPFSILAFLGTPELAEATKFVQRWLATEELLSPEIYPLEQIADAQRALEQGKTHGKIVFSV
jgi:NADPH2:quinone reductase